MAKCFAATGGSYEIKGGQIDNIKKTSLDLDVKVIAEQLCNWAAPEYGDEGLSIEALIWKGLAIAVATLNTIAQIAIAQKRYSIAKEYANIASDRWNRFKNAYAPFERDLLNEAGRVEEYDPDYDAARARGREYTNSAFTSANSQLSAKASAYSLCVDPSLLDDIDYAQGMTADDGTNFGYRSEEAWSIHKRDQRWNRRSDLLNLGRNTAREGVEYANRANQMLSQLGNTLNEGTQGAISLLGYLSNVRNTQYPAMFSGMTPFFGQAGAFGDFGTMGYIY